jgi:hypothetical protein
VASLAEPPEEIWTVPFDIPTRHGWDALQGQQIVVMDGLLVVPPGSMQDYAIDPATGVLETRPGFTGVVAVDPDSGEVVWRVPVEESPECGPTGYDASTSTEVLVCVHGAADAREALAITPDGATRSRPLDLAEGEQVSPGPDGLVVRTVRTGAEIGLIACHESGDCPPRSLDQGRALQVTAEDAGTGARRWMSIFEFDPTLSHTCLTSDGDAPSDEPVIDLELTTVDVGAESVVVGGCGVSATLSVDGVPLDQAGDVADPSQIWVTELGSGRFALQGNGTETTVVNADGEVLRTLDGWPQSDRTSPDAPDDLWFVTRPSGIGFAAVREDGSEAWMALEDSRLALAGRDTVVVNRGNGLRGLDRATGAKIWNWADDDPRGLASFRTFTDGEIIAAQYLPQEGTGEGKLVALDLSTGEELWEVPIAGSVVAVGGHLVEFTSEGMRGLG